jgi:hypothetical protein
MWMVLTGSGIRFLLKSMRYGSFWSFIIQY